MLRFKERVEKQLEAIRKENKEIKEFFSFINQNLGKITANFEKLEKSVAKATSINESAIALIKGISQQIKDAAGDEAKLSKLTDNLDASEAGLAAAVAANTPAAPVESPAPVEPPVDLPAPPAVDPSAPEAPVEGIPA